MIDRIAPRFARYEPLRRASELMLGMVSGLDRKNCWTIAEHRGDTSPDGLQHLLSRAQWDADGVRDDLREYVIDAFGDPGAILVVDETGDVKKGVHSVGVQRQYTGTAGRIENSQVAVYLTYAAPRGHALIDRASVSAAVVGRRSRSLHRRRNPSQQAVFRDQTHAGRSTDHPCRRGESARSVGGRRRGLRSRPPATGGHPRPPAGLRAGHLGQPARAHPCRPDPRRSTPGTAAQLGLAETLRRSGQPRPALLLLGLDHPAGRRRHRHRLALFADPPQRRHRRARLPALLLTTAGHLARPGRRGGTTLAHRGILSRRQRLDRARSTPSSALDLLAPLDHPGHARPCLPGRGHRHRTSTANPPRLV